jgi:hypothetical protein
MDTFFIITLGVVFVLWVLAAIVYPFMKEREQKQFNKNSVKYTDGDNT